MDYFTFEKGSLYCENIPVSDIADKYGTPLYIYSFKTIVRHIRVIQRAFGDIPHLICYAVKANPNLAILKLAGLAGAGADVVSGGELESACASGISPGKIVFSGVGKTDAEIASALNMGILYISAESMGELETISEIAGKRGIPAPVGIRVNPDIDPKTHPYIATGLKKTKFGVDVKTAKKAFEFCGANRWLDPVAISMHIGSQVKSIRPYIDATGKLAKLYTYLINKEIYPRYFDIGGGWAAPLQPRDKFPGPGRYISSIRSILIELDATIIVEPGRSIVGNAGILVTKVLGTKRNGGRNYCMVDAGMNDFIRPALYGSEHRIEHVHKNSRAESIYNVVGPVCESSDFLAKKAKLGNPQKGDYLAIFTAGAYGSSMSSNYNSRPRPAEIAVAGTKLLVIRKRENKEDLLRNQNSRGVQLKIIKDLAKGINL